MCIERGTAKKPQGKSLLLAPHPQAHTTACPMRPIGTKCCFPRKSPLENSLPNSRRNSLMRQCMRELRKKCPIDPSGGGGSRRVRKAIARPSSIRPIYLARWIFIAAAGCPLPGHESRLHECAGRRRTACKAHELGENRQRGFPTQEVWTNNRLASPITALSTKQSGASRRNAQIAQYFRQGVHVNQRSKETAVVSQFLKYVTAGRRHKTYL